MGVKKLPGQEPKAESKEKKVKNYQDKPKVQDYYRDNDTKEGESFVVVKAKMTSDWLIIETEEWVGFLYGSSTLAEYLIEVIAPESHNKQGCQLVALAAKKTKNKFVLGLDDEVKAWYYFNEESKLLEISVEKNEDFLVQGGQLKVEDFGFTK